MISRITRAGMRRLIALHPECRRMQLFETIGVPEIVGASIAEVQTRMAAYALDPGGRPLLGNPAWLDRCLVATPIAPGCAEVQDDIAAVLAVGAVNYDERLLRQRFAPRADDMIAAATFSLSPKDAARAIVQLALQPGPDESVLHLALLQAGLALAWRPDLVGAEGTNAVVDALLELVDRKSPRPLLDAVAPILGALASETDAVRDAVMQRFLASRQRVEARRDGGGSFLDEFHALDRERKMPDEDYYLTLPDRQVVEACAKILGRSAETLDAAGFVKLQNVVLEGEVGETLLPPFVGGLINAAAQRPLAQLVRHLLDTRDVEPRALGLDIAAQLPLDDITEVVIDALGDDRKRIRIKAVAAATLLDPEHSVPALLARLDDPEPDVCAVAARALVELGQRDAIEDRRMPGEIAIGKSRERTAVVRAAIGDASGEVVAPLLGLALAEAEREDEDAPIVEALGAALGTTVEGIALAAEIIGELPDALPIIALSLAGEGVPLIPPVREPLARALEPLITDNDTGMIALGLLARFSHGDVALHDRIVALARTSEGYAGQTLEALANVRVRSEGAAAILAPIIKDREHLAGALTAVAVAGVAVPVEHSVWADIRELLALGATAGSVVYQALVSRARVRVVTES